MRILWRPRRPALKANCHAFPLLFPNQTGHGGKESRTRVKVRQFAHYRSHLSEVRSNYNKVIIVRGMSRPAPAFSLQSVTERFRRLPCLFIADMGIADRRANVLVAEQFLDFPQILSHLVEEDRRRRVP